MSGFMLVYATRSDFLGFYILCLFCVLSEAGLYEH